MPELPTIKQWTDVRKVVHLRDNYKCTYCGIGDTVLGLDHIVPISCGGGWELSNLTTACRSCNTKKGNRTPDQWKAGAKPLKKSGYVERFKIDRTIRISRKKVEDLISNIKESGGAVKDLYTTIGITKQAFYAWKKQGKKDWIICRRSTYNKLIAAYEKLKED